MSDRKERPTLASVSPLRRPQNQPETEGMWHVTVLMSGPKVDIDDLVPALRRLTECQPFLGSIRYAPDRAEIHYWEEAETLDDAAAMALRLWPEYREQTGLPDWDVGGIEVVAADLRDRRSRGMVPATMVLGELRPLT